LMSRLGFTLTPRGYHSLGSINHLMMFEHDYLELVGLPSGTDVLRKDVLESPRGLNGLVFQASDIDTCQRTLRDSGLAMLEPQSFSRPVTIDGVEHLARFRTVRTAPELFEAGRVYYCQHYTPELVWHRPWMSHPNGCHGLSELVIVTSNLETDVPRYATAAQAPSERQGDDWTIVLPHGFRLALISPARYRERYGEKCVAADSRQFFRRYRFRYAGAWAHPRSRFIHSRSARWNERGFAGGADSVPQYAAGISQASLIKHDLFGKPPYTFPDHALVHWIVVAKRLPYSTGIGGKFRAGT
jgi:hypothetical protein